MIGKRKKTFLRRRKPGSYKFAILYPNLFKAGSVSLAVHTLYNFLKNYGFVDFFFLDVRGLISGLKLKDFDVIFVSIAYENDFINLIKILKEEGIELFAKKRFKPIIIGGGIALSAAYKSILPVFNLVIRGDVESSLPLFFSDFREYLLNPPIEEVWFEDAYNLADITKTISYSAFISPQSSFPYTFLIELIRGCPYRCKFCLLSNLLGKIKLSRAEYILEIINEKSINIPKIGFVGSAIMDYPFFEFILNNLPKWVKYVSLSSVNIKKMNFNILKKLAEYGNETITIAPETYDEEIRFKLGKKIKNKEFFEFAKMCQQAGVRKIKLYFMLNLPFGGDDEEGFVDFILEIKKRFKGKIYASFSWFVPKPFTPFEKYEFKPYKNYSFEILKKHKIKVSIGNYEEFKMQAFIDKGGENVFSHLLNYAEFN